MSVITCRSNVLRGSKAVPGSFPNEAQYNYVGASTGPWLVRQMNALRGSALSPVSHLDIVKGPLCRTPTGAAWVLSGLVRNTRYVSREERDLRGVNRMGGQHVDAAPCAALIVVRRSPDWWELGHQARREILESRKVDFTSGLQYLSGVVRRWQHRRDLSEQFDYVTWFEYEPRDSAAFDDLLAAWRASEEWNYVDRECDVRLVGAGW
jgi:hypothetical protein